VPESECEDPAIVDKASIKDDHPRPSIEFHEATENLKAWVGKRESDSKAEKTPEASGLKP
jgi:hypothetical protein